MEVAYLKITKNPPPFLRYFKFRGYYIKEIHPLNLPAGISALSSDTIFIPFESSKDKKVWLEVARCVDARNIKRLFPKHGFIEMCLQEDILKEFIEKKVILSDKGVYHFLFYRDEKGLKTIGNGLSPHKKLTKRSPLNLISKHDEKKALDLLETVLRELDFGFFHTKLESNGNGIINIELNPIPDLSTPARESVLLAESFGFSYEMLLSIIERALRS